MPEYVFRVDLDGQQREFSLPLRDAMTAQLYAGRTLNLLLAARALRTGTVAVGRPGPRVEWLGYWRTVEQGPFTWTAGAGSEPDRAEAATPNVAGDDHSLA